MPVLAFAAHVTIVDVVIAVALVALAIVVLLVLPGPLSRLRWRWIARHGGSSERDELTGLSSRASLIADVAGFVDGDRDPAEQLTLHLFDLVGFKKYNDSYGFAAGDALLRHVARRASASLEGDTEIYRLRGAQFALLCRKPIAERHIVRAQLSERLREAGEGFRVECASGTIVIPRQASGLSEALKLADQELHAERSALRRKGLDEGVITPAASSGGLPGSPHEVTDLAVSVGHFLGLADEELDVVHASTRWRDVGMMAIPDSILQSRDKLDDEQWRFVKLHTLIGERLLRSYFGLHRVAGIVRSSHERWDGNGYPDGLAGHDIPLGARIVFVCSAFQDMTSPRAHRPALATSQALAELRRNAGRQFDPHVVAAFADAFADTSLNVGASVD